MSGADGASAAIAAETLVAALTREMPSYMDRIARTAGGPITDLWSIVLASSGKMVYASEVEAASNPSAERRVPDAPLSGGRTRFELWRAALLEVIAILGDPEARYRTGFDTTTLTAAVKQYFDQLD